MISLEALQAIDSIDRKGSFAAAAEELYRVPSAITYTIKKLEEQLNIKLFDRERQRAQLTPTGHLILEQGRKILGQVHQLEEQARQVESGWETQLRIVVDTILPVGPLWPLLSELQQERTWLNIQILEESLSGAWEALVTQRADIVIGVTGDEPAGGDWLKQTIGTMQTDLYCGADHPAGQLEPPITHEQLKEFTHIIINDSARNLPHRNVDLLGLRQILAVPTMHQKYQALIHNTGISRLPKHWGAIGIAEGKLKRIAIEATPFPQTQFMAWPKQATGKASQWLRAKIIEEKTFEKEYY